MLFKVKKGISSREVNNFIRPLLLLNKHQVLGGGADLHCYQFGVCNRSEGPSRGSATELSRPATKSTELPDAYAKLSALISG